MAFGSAMAAIALLLCAAPSAAAYQQPRSSLRHQTCSPLRLRPSARVAMGPRPIHSDGFKSKFTVEKASEALMQELAVKSWPTWSTAGSAKYKVGVKSPLKVYDCNELSYIIAGKMEIMPQETGKPVLVQAGDFVTFPEDFACNWFVIEEVKKHYFLYD